MDQAHNSAEPGINHDPANELEYNEIVPGLYVGTNLCCTTHFDQELVNMNIQADMSIEGERIAAPYGAQFFVWLPVQDKHAPSQQQLRFGVESLEVWMEMGVNVYLHCQNGHGRGPTMAAAYLMKAMDLQPDEAIAFVKQRRPVIHLEDVQVEALVNFRRLLDGIGISL